MSESTYDRAVAGALERLAETEAQAARTARAANLPDDAKFFQRGANAYAKALLYWQQGIRPKMTPNGYVLPSQRAGEAPHKLHRDGDWICTCPAGESMHWAKALIIGMEVAEDDMARFDGGDDDGDAGELPTPPTPITLTLSPSGLILTRGDESYTAIGPASLGCLIRQLMEPAPTSSPAQLGSRLAAARRALLAV